MDAALEDAREAAQLLDSKVDPAQASARFGSVLGILRERFVR